MYMEVNHASYVVRHIFEIICETSWGQYIKRSNEGNIK